MFNKDSQVSEMFDEQPLDHFFTRYEDASLAPCTNAGIESNSTLYHELYKVVEGKPLWQQKATLLKATAGNRGRVAVGEANVLVPEKDDKPSWQARRVYLDSCGSFPLIQEKELHGVRGASEYGLPPLRFSTLESKTGRYNKVGVLRLWLHGEPMRSITAYAYTTKPGIAHSKANCFYLFDMSTLLGC